MKYKSIIILGIFILPLLLVTATLILNWNSFFINEDSYEFLLPARIVEGRLGSLGSEYFISFYNRAGYALFIKILALLSVFSNPDAGHLLIRGINLLCFFYSCCILYRLAFYTTHNRKISYLIYILAITTTSWLFVSSLILNDAIAIALLLTGFWFLITRKNITVFIIIIFTVLTILRIEYLIFLLPFLWLEYQNKKRLALIMPFSIVLHFILFIPYFTQEWFAYQMTTVTVLSSYVVYYVCFVVVYLILNTFFKPYRIKLYIFFAILVLLYLMYSAQTYSLFATTIVSNIGVTLFGLVAVILYIIIQPSLKNEVGKYVLLFLECFLLGFIFYRTEYFHHIIVLIPFGLLYIGCMIKLLVEQILKSSFNTKIKKYLRYSVAIVCFVLLGTQPFLYKNQFGAYTTDLAQLTYQKTQTYIQNNSINGTNLVLVSDFSKALYYWSGISSQQYKGEQIFNVSKPELIETVLVVIFEPSAPQIPGFTLQNKENTDIVVPYKSAESFQARLGVDPDTLYFYVYRKN